MNLLFDTAWQEFCMLLPTEQACVALMYEHFPENLRQCRNCRGTRIQRDPGDRVGKCLNCKKNVLITATTFFHRVRNVRAWLAAVWFFEHGVTINSNQFGKLLGIAYSSARNIFVSIANIIENHLPADAASVPGSLFTAVMSKRSRLTPANEHPSAEEEQQKSEKTEHSTTQDNQPNIADRHAHRTETEQALLEFISQTPSGIGQLAEQAGMPTANVCAALTMLEIDGVIKRLPFDRYIIAADSAPATQFSEEIMLSVTAAVNFVLRKFHGVSRKYLQLYLAAYWSISDKSRWKRWALLDACLKDERSPSCIVEYVSPALLKLVVTKGPTEETG